MKLSSPNIFLWLLIYVQGYNCFNFFWAHNAVLDKNGLFAFSHSHLFILLEKTKLQKTHWKGWQHANMAHRGTTDLKSLESFRTNSTKEQTVDYVPDKILEQIMIFSYLICIIKSKYRDTFTCYKDLLQL